jgi:hypothetical protein
MVSFPFSLQPISQQQFSNIKNIVDGLTSLAVTKLTEQIDYFGHKKTTRKITRFLLEDCASSNQIFIPEDYQRAALRICVVSLHCFQGGDMKTFGDMTCTLFEAYFDHFNSILLYEAFFESSRKEQPSRTYSGEFNDRETRLIEHRTHKQDVSEAYLAYVQAREAYEKLEKSSPKPDVIEKPKLIEAEPESEPTPSPPPPTLCPPPPPPAPPFGTTKYVKKKEEIKEEISVDQKLDECRIAFSRMRFNLLNLLVKPSESNKNFVDADKIKEMKSLAECRLDLIVKCYEVFMTNHIMSLETEWWTKWHRELYPSANKIERSVGIKKKELSPLTRVIHSIKEGKQKIEQAARDLENYAKKIAGLTKEVDWLKGCLNANNLEDKLNELGLELNGKDEKLKKFDSRINNRNEQLDKVRKTLADFLKKYCSKEYENVLDTVSDVLQLKIPKNVALYIRENKNAIEEALSKIKHFENKRERIHRQRNLIQIAKEYIQDRIKHREPSAKEISLKEKIVAKEQEQALLENERVSLKHAIEEQQKQHHAVLDRYCSRLSQNILDRAEQALQDLKVVDDLIQLINEKIQALIKLRNKRKSALKDIDAANLDLRKKREECMQQKEPGDEEAKLNKLVEEEGVIKKKIEEYGKSSKEFDACIKKTEGELLKFLRGPKIPLAKSLLYEEEDVLEYAKRVIAKLEAWEGVRLPEKEVVSKESAAKSVQKNQPLCLPAFSAKTEDVEEEERNEDYNEWFQW